MASNAMPPYGGTVLREGSRGPDVSLIQRWLGGVSVDGRFGSKTDAAIRQFQRLNGLTVDGAVGTNTWDALYQNWASRHGEGEIWPGIPMRTGQSGATVKSAQQRLQSLVPELVADGHYGPRTREAVLAWQVVHDLTPDGILGRRTWTSLYSHMAA